MAEKIGEATRERIMEVVKNALTAEGLDVLRVASGSFGVPAVEGEEETAIRIVFQIPNTMCMKKHSRSSSSAQRQKRSVRSAPKRRQRRLLRRRKRVNNHSLFCIFMRGPDAHKNILFYFPKNY